MKLLFAALLMISSFSVLANSENYIRFGGFIPTHQEGVIQFEKNGLGTTLDIEDGLKLETETRALRLDGFYRFNKNHRIELSYYSLHSEGGSITDRTINIGDDTISAGASIESSLDLDIFKTNYTYSIYLNQDIEFGMSLGLHITQIDSKNKFEGDINNSPFSTVNVNVLLTAPLPVLGWRVHYGLTDRFKMSLTYDISSVELAGLHGTYSDFQLYFDYEIYRQFGVGFGYNRTDYNLGAKEGTTIYNPKYDINFNTDLGGLMLFASYRF